MPPLARWRKRVVKAHREAADAAVAGISQDANGASKGIGS
jgi:hypothetical protein